MLQRERRMLGVGRGHGELLAILSMHRRISQEPVQLLKATKEGVNMHINEGQLLNLLRQFLQVIAQPNAPVKVLRRWELALKVWVCRK